MADIPNQVQSTTGPSLLERKQQELDNSPQGQIRKSLEALQNIPDPEKRAELARPLILADMAARKQGGY